MSNSQDECMRHVRLVPLTEAHLDNLLRWLGDQSVRDGVLIDQIITAESHRAWFASQYNDHRLANFAVVAGDIHVGAFGYRNLSRRHGTGELWMYIDPEHQGHGLGKSALRAGLAIGFKDFGLRKILLVVDRKNARAISLYEGSGFVVEGRLRAEQLYRGEPVDLIRMARFPD